MSAVDYIALGIIILLIICSVRYMILSRKNGCSGCCSNCKGCGNSGSCINKPMNEKEKSPDTDEQ